MKKGWNKLCAGSVTTSFSLILIDGGARPRVATLHSLCTDPANFTSKRALQGPFSGPRIRDETISPGPENTIGLLQIALSPNRPHNNFFVRIQTVDVWQPKFQSIPLCAVDARISNLQFGSSLYKDGVHEAQLKL